MRTVTLPSMLIGTVLLIGTLACGTTPTPAPAGTGTTTTTDAAASDATVTPDTATATDGSVADTTASDTASTSDAPPTADTATTDTVIGPTVAIADLPSALASAVCQSIANCPPAQSLFEGAKFSSPEACKAFLAPLVAGTEFGEMVALVKAGQIAYDGTKAAACLQIFASQCGAFGGPKPQGPCAGVFKGLGALASPCAVDEQCATGYCKEATAPGCPRACANPVGKGEACMTHDGCTGELLCSAGKCIDNKPVAAGGICDNGLQCVDGYGCFPKDSFDTCEPLTDSGACGSHKNCKPGAFCDQGTCKSIETNGKECGAGKGSCGPKFVCLQPSLSKPGTCGPAKKLGDECNLYTECGFLDVVCSGASIDAGRSKPGHCAPWSKNAQSCTAKPGVASGPFPCEPPYVCSQESGVCGGKLGKGSKCLQKSDCQKPLVCAGTCQEALAQGAACQPFGGVPCQEGLQCTDKKCAPPVCK